MLIPIFGALSLASGTILERFILKKKSIQPKPYQTASFLAVVLLMLPLVGFFWRIDTLAYSFKNILIFLVVIVLALIANYLMYFSMKWEKISNLEPAKMMEPLFIVLIALVFSFFIDGGMYARNFKLIIPALIAGAALIFSHIRKHHLEFNKYFRAAIIGSFFFAMELVVSRLILNYYSPITFYFLRCSGVFLLGLVFFRPNLSKIPKDSLKYIIITSAIWVAYRVLIYSGYTSLGIVETTLIVMLGPVFIYVFAWKFLKEKLDWRNIVASIIIIASVLYGVLA